MLWAYAHNGLEGGTIKMARPPCCRRIDEVPQCRVFKPAGIPARLLEETVLTLDELESVRLADLSGLYQETAAESMNVSRQTFGRILESARHKIAEALVLGKSLRIEGGNVEMSETRKFRCLDCQHVWAEPLGGGRPAGCPNCQSGNAVHENSGRGCCGGRRRARNGFCGGHGHHHE